MIRLNIVILNSFEKKNRELLAAIAADDADFAEQRAADQQAEAESQNEAAARDEEKSERTFTNLPPIMEFSASPEQKRTVVAL